jgi:hypothetical protein
MARAFQIHSHDNVATLLEDAAAGDVIEILGVATQRCTATSAISTGHKVALRPAAPGEPVIKFGVRIGHVTKTVAVGDWVHLHNLSSDLDERSGTLDLHSGAPTDSASAYV